MVVYTAAITACARSSQWLQAEEVLAEMQRSIVRTNQFTYSAVISAFQRGAQWEEVPSGRLFCWSMAVPVGFSSEAPSGRIRGTLGAISAAWSVEGVGPEALSLLGQMARPNLVAFNAVLAACGANQWPLVLQILHKLRGRKLQANCTTKDGRVGSLTTLETVFDTYFDVCWD